MGGAEDYVVEFSNTSAGWYRKYKSGWVEQCILINVPAWAKHWAESTVELIIPMKDSSYSALLGNMAVYGADDASGGYATPIDNSHVKIRAYNSVYTTWLYVCGFAL